MGLEKNTVLIKGIKINEDTLKDIRFDETFDKRLMPCIEGDSDISLYHGEGSNNVYLGIEMANSGGHDHESMQVKIPDKLNVRNELIRLGFSTNIKDIKIWFLIIIVDNL